MTNQLLVAAIQSQEPKYRRALDRATDTIENDPDLWDEVRQLREAIELVRCLRRVVPYLTYGQIHEAFGAPGDFGYDTLIGDALARFYRGAE